MDRNIKIMKRNKTEVVYDPSKIKNAIKMAIHDSEKESYDEEIVHNIINAIEYDIIENEKLRTVEDISDLTEKYLAKMGYYDSAKKYILFRSQQTKFRLFVKKSKNKFLSDQFLSKYKHAEDPFPSPLGAIVDARTYNRWLPDEKRREHHWEKVVRMVEFSCQLDKNCTKEEAEQLYDLIYNIKLNLSGRIAWNGNTDTSFIHPTSLYNCAFDIVDNMQMFRELYYNLMLGVGQGVRILFRDIAKLPKLRQGINLNHKYVETKKSKDRNEYTTTFHKSKTHIEIIVGDSREGWTDALDMYLKLFYEISYRDITEVTFNYDNIRPTGMRLKRFGGTSSGYKSLKIMFDKMHTYLNVKQSGYHRLKPIDALDIIDSIAYNVVSGNIRRTAIIVLGDQNDQEFIKAKDNLYTSEGINKDIIHRAMSNNTIFYENGKPSREEFRNNFKRMRTSGEPGILNYKAALKRNPNAQGLNPCAEIILDSKQFCNLTNLNMLAFVNEDGTYNEEEMLEAQRLSSRAGYRITLMDLEHNEWSNKQKRDALLGVSLSGIQDFKNATNISKEDYIKLLNKLRKVAQDAGKEYAHQLGLNEPLLTTTIKPSGTSSTLFGESPGAHYSHSPYYIRRVRMKSDDAVLQVCRELNYNINPEVGQNNETAVTFVVDIPMKSPKGVTKYDVSVKDQINEYLLLQKEYVDHNTSLTVHVRPDEWEIAEQMVYDNWDNIIGLSFVALDDSFYQLMPYEKITEETYNELVKELQPFNHSLLKKYETEEFFEDDDVDDDPNCTSGVCSFSGH